MAACRFCRKEIPSGALVCTHCDRDQSRWRTEFKYWSGVVGLITLIVSGATFSLNLGRDLWQKVFGEPLAIGDFSSTDFLRMWNISNIDVWIKDIRIESAGPTYSFGLTSNTVIEPKKVAEINFRKLAETQWEGTVADLLKGGFADDYATDLTPIEQADLRDDILPTKNAFVPDFLLKDGPEHVQLAQIHGDKLFTFACEMKITYVTISNGELDSYDVPCVGTVRRVERPVP